MCFNLQRWIGHNIKCNEKKLIRKTHNICSFTILAIKRISPRKRNKKKAFLKLTYLNLLNDSL